VKDVVSTIGLDLVSGADPHEVMLRLVAVACQHTGADRCTLTSLDQDVLRVEASYQPGGAPAFIGREFPMTYLDDQPLLRSAVETRRIVTGGSLAEGGRIDPQLQASLEEMHHTAIVPLPLGTRVGGVLIFSRRADQRFEMTELDEMQQLGILAVLALRNARLVEDVRRAQARGLETLLLMTQFVATSEDAADFFGKMSETVAGLVEAHRAVFWHIADGRLEPHPRAFGFTQVALAKMRLRVPAPGDDALAELVYAGAALRHTVAEGGAGPVMDGLLRELGLRDQLAVPWRTAAGPIGVLAAYDSRRGFTTQDEWIMRLAARASALVWQGFEAQQRVRRLESDERTRLQAHASRMADLERQKSEFLQLASHELRTPITLVTGYLSMLEDQTLGELPAAAANIVPLLSSRMTQMNDLVDRLLTASRMEDASPPPDLAEVRVDQLVADVVHSVDGTGPRPRRVIMGATGEVMVRADAEKVETIVGNLVSNAIKYSPDGGDVRVQVSEEPGWVAIAVTDEGVGIAESDLTKLFQPFSRIDTGAASEVMGTGLGLYLSRNLALLQGGDIFVESRPGEGSTFTLRLPRSLREAAGGNR